MLERLKVDRDLTERLRAKLQDNRYIIVPTPGEDSGRTNKARELAQKIAKVIVVAARNPGVGLTLDHLFIHDNGQTVPFTTYVEEAGVDLTLRLSDLKKIFSGSEPDSSQAADTAANQDIPEPAGINSDHLDSLAGVDPANNGESDTVPDSKAAPVGSEKSMPEAEDKDALNTNASPTDAVTSPQDEPTPNENGSAPAETDAGQQTEDKSENGSAPNDPDLEQKNSQQSGKVGQESTNNGDKGNGEPPQNNPEKKFSPPKNLKDLLDRIKNMKPRDWLTILLIALITALLFGRNNEQDTTLTYAVKATGTPVPGEVLPDDQSGFTRTDRATPTIQNTEAQPPEPSLPTFTPTQELTATPDTGSLPLSEIYERQQLIQERLAADEFIMEQLELFAVGYQYNPEQTQTSWDESANLLVADYLSSKPDVIQNLVLLGNGKSNIEQIDETGKKELIAFFSKFGIYTGVVDYYRPESSLTKKLFSLSGRSELMLVAMQTYFQVYPSAAEEILGEIRQFDGSESITTESLRNLAKFLQQFFNDYSVFSNELSDQVCGLGVPEAIKDPQLDMRGCPLAIETSGGESLSRLVASTNLQLFRGFDQSAYTGRSPFIERGNSLSYYDQLIAFSQNPMFYAVPLDTYLLQGLYENPITRVQYFGSWSLPSASNGEMTTLPGSIDQSNYTLTFMNPEFNSTLMGGLEPNSEVGILNSAPTVLRLYNRFLETGNPEDLELAYLSYKLLTSRVNLAELEQAGNLDLTMLRQIRLAADNDDYEAGFAYWPAGVDRQERNTAVLELLQAFITRYNQGRDSSSSQDESTIMQLRMLSALISAAELINNDQLAASQDLSNYGAIDFNDPEYLQLVRYAIQALKSNQ